MNKPPQIFQNLIRTLLSILCLLILQTGYTEESMVRPEKVLELGSGWSNNTVNTVIFRHHGVVSRGNYQFTAYYDVQSRMVFVRRDLRDNSVKTARLKNGYNTRDSHNSISLGIDPDGYLHLSYDHHGTPLNYRRSTEPLSIDTWSEPLKMTGVFEDRVTYPYFVMAPANTKDRQGKGKLYFIYRHASSGNGDICLKVYDHTKKIWEDRAVRFIKGMEQKPWTSNAYWNHPAFDSLGRMYFTWVWRVNRGGPPGLVNNHNIGYACTPDGGETWLSSRDLPLSIPLTPTNSEVIWAISPGTNLINQCSSAIDSKDRLHVVFYADDPGGIPQYQHLWFNVHVWQCDVISNRTGDFKLSGGGTLRLPISRPEIVIDPQNRVYVIYRGDLSGDRLVAQQLNPPNYKPPGKTIILWDHNLDHMEPVLDRIRWKHNGILSMLIQKNYQPDHDRPEDHPAEPVFLVDWNLLQ